MVRQSPMTARLLNLLAFLDFDDIFLNLFINTINRSFLL